LTAILCQKCEISLISCNGRIAIATVVRGWALSSTVKSTRLLFPCELACTPHLFSTLA
jgi:hypothetical protein